MERLNTKLYEKHMDLKKRKISEESERNAKVQEEADKYLSVKELSSKNERLRKLLPAEDHCNNKFGDMEPVPTETPSRLLKAGSQDIGELVAPSSNTAPSDLQKNVAVSIQCNDHQDGLLMPDFCRRNLSSSEMDCAKCVYQMLVESLVRMKFSMEHQTDGFCLSVMHQSCGNKVLHYRLE